MIEERDGAFKEAKEMAEEEGVPVREGDWIQIKSSGQLIKICLNWSDEKGRLCSRISVVPRETLAKLNAVLDADAVL